MNLFEKAIWKLTSRRKVRRVLTSLPRSGTHWLKFMISSVLGEDPLEERLNGWGQDTNNIGDLGTALELAATTRLVYDHFYYDLHKHMLNQDCYPGLRLVLLYRNPLDVLVSSAYYTQKVKHLPGHVTPEQYLHEYLRGKTDPAFEMFSLPLREKFYQSVIGWRNNTTCLEVRYEDLRSDTTEQLARVLDWMAIRHTPDQLEGAIRRYTFENLSEGRSLGEVDNASHYRRGEVGTWHDLLGAADLRIIREQIGDFCQELGYPIDPV